MAEENRWEYRVLSVGSAFSSPKDEAMEALLNEWGAEGWDVFSLEQHLNGTKIRVVAKRPLTSDASRRRSWPG
jgi:hypothetical protein